MKKHKKITIFIIVFTSFTVLLLIFGVFSNFSNIIIYCKNDIAVIEEDFSSIYFDERIYVPLNKFGDGPPINDKTVYYDAAVKNDDFLDCVLFGSTIAKNTDYNDIIWLFTESDLENAEYSMFIAQDVLLLE